MYLLVDAVAPPALALDPAVVAVVTAGGPAKERENIVVNVGNLTGDFEI